MCNFYIYIMHITRVFLVVQKPCYAQPYLCKKEKFLYPLKKRRLKVLFPLNLKLILYTLRHYCKNPIILPLCKLTAYLR